MSEETGPRQKSDQNREGVSCMETSNYGRREAVTPLLVL